MEERRFLVQGSASQPYEVHFILEGQNLRAYCSCPAGENGQYCKHRFGILAGITKGIVSTNVTDVDVVRFWLRGTDVEKAMTAMADAEREYEKAKKRFSDAKKAVARAMRE